MVRNLSDKVKYIGVDDLDLDLFESQYIVPEGMAYNSFVILDDKVAVLDTADARKADEWKANLKESLGKSYCACCAGIHLEASVISASAGLRLVIHKMKVADLSA